MAQKLNQLKPLSRGQLAAATTLPKGSNVESKTPNEPDYTRKESDNGTGDISQLAGDGVLPTTGNSGGEVADTGVPTGKSGYGAVLTGAGDEGTSYNLGGAGMDGLSPTPTVNDYHWPVVYDYEGMVMLSYTGLPQGGGLITEITNTATVEEVTAIARSYGFSAKSILNHMVDCGYQFKNEDDSNVFYSMDY